MSCRVLFLCLTNQPYPCQLVVCKQSTPWFWLQIVPTSHHKHLVLFQLKWHQKCLDISLKLPSYWLQTVPTCHLKYFVCCHKHSWKMSRDLVKNTWFQATNCPMISQKYLVLVPLTQSQIPSSDCFSSSLNEGPAEYAEASASCHPASCLSLTEKSDRHWLDFGICIQKTTNYTPVLLTRIWQKKAVVLRYILEETIESDNPVRLMTYSIWSWSMDPALDTVIVLQGGSLPSWRDWCQSSPGSAPPICP